MSPRDSMAISYRAGSQSLSITMNFRPAFRPSSPCARCMMFVGIAGGTFWLSGAGLCTLSAYRALPECTCEPHTQTAAQRCTHRAKRAGGKLRPGVRDRQQHHFGGPHSQAVSRGVRGLLTGLRLAEHRQVEQALAQAPPAWPLTLIRRFRRSCPRRHRAPAAGSLHAPRRSRGAPSTEIVLGAAHESASLGWRACFRPLSRHLGRGKAGGCSQRRMCKRH
jgi:hypothetical protein